MTTIAVIGGTGLYELEQLQDVSEQHVDTPFGQASSAIISGTLDNNKILFLARHGKNHEFLPHEVNYRANIFALKALGARWIIAVNATGSLREEIAPGDFVIPDQLIDFTKTREQSFFGKGINAYPSMADPFCPEARKAILSVIENHEALQDIKVHPTGASITIEGPMLSSRAESEMFRSWGADLIGMTNSPEAKLAREAEIAYASISLITDYDCWKADAEDVTAASVMEVMKLSGQRVQKVLPDILNKIGSSTPSTLAAEALKEALMTDLKTLTKEQKEALEPLLGKYFSA